MSRLILTLLWSVFGTQLLGPVAGPKGKPHLTEFPLVPDAPSAPWNDVRRQMAIMESIFQLSTTNGGDLFNPVTGECLFYFLHLPLPNKGAKCKANEQPAAAGSSQKKQCRVTAQLLGQLEPLKEFVDPTAPATLNASTSNTPSTSSMSVNPINNLVPMLTTTGSIHPTTTAAPANGSPSTFAAGSHSSCSHSSINAGASMPINGLSTSTKAAVELRRLACVQCATVVVAASAATKGKHELPDPTPAPNPKCGHSVSAAESDNGGPTYVETCLKQTAEGLIQASVNVHPAQIVIDQLLDLHTLQIAVNTNKTAIDVALKSYLPKQLEKLSRSHREFAHDPLGNGALHALKDTLVSVKAITVQLHINDVFTALQQQRVMMAQMCGHQWIEKHLNPVLKCLLKECAAARMWIVEPHEHWVTHLMCFIQLHQSSPKRIIASDYITGFPNQQLLWPKFTPTTKTLVVCLADTTRATIMQLLPFHKTDQSSKIATCFLTYLVDTLGSGVLLLLSTWAVFLDPS
ncbi:hypothetical protein C8F04DRAFT_1180222 [Mycena alexandri]|uniref:Uncharacterized protein n=1 Tax=Mycena alexandri TaxID=1745969 RepID=A0AAD6T0Y1_9AGAR|nr:hypothetical protein C8F04DRAFT_1180222 [Mycena alexandri]